MKGGSFTIVCVRENFHRPRPLLLATPTFNHIQFVIVFFEQHARTQSTGQLQKVNPKERHSQGKAILLGFRLANSMTSLTGRPYTVQRCRIHI